MRKKVIVALSIYKPDAKYLKWQLESINKQTYENIEVLVLDDCPDSYMPEENITKAITKFDVKLFRNETNLGFIKSFEKLTELAQGDYIAYCDHDDIWEENKIELCVNELEKTDSKFCTCNMTVIDENNNVILENFSEYSKNDYFTWETGENITKYAAFLACTNGNTILMDLPLAKEALPFVNLPYYSHDFWLGLFASCKCKLARVDKPLVKYRMYSNNTSGVLKGVKSKKDYYETRVMSKYKAFLELKQRVDIIPDRELIEDCFNARIHKNIFKIFKYRMILKRYAVFEIAIKFIPDFLFKRMVSLVQSRITNNSKK